MKFSLPNGILAVKFRSLIPFKLFFLLETVIARSKEGRPTQTHGIYKQQQYVSKKTPSLRVIGFAFDAEFEVKIDMS